MLARRSSSRRLKVRNKTYRFHIYLSNYPSTGRWPEKSVKFMLRLLKNAESNADAKNIDLEDLFIKSIVVQQAPVLSSNLYPRFPSLTPRVPFRKPVVAHTVPTVVLTLTRVIPCISKSSLPLLRSRLRRPQTRPPFL